MFAQPNIDAALENANADWQCRHATRCAAMRAALECVAVVIADDDAAAFIEYVDNMACVYWLQQQRYNSAGEFVETVRAVLATARAVQFAHEL